MERYIKRGLVVLSAAVLVFCCGGAVSCAQPGFNPEDSFSEANSLYRHNQYDAALAEYEKILDNGFLSGNIYYNLGNCYFKKGELGRAILNYERAKSFIPGDSDLRSNYEYARSSLNLGPDVLPGSWFIRTLDKAFAGMNINVLALAVSLIYLLILVLTALRVLLDRKIRFYKTIIVGIALVFVVSAAALYRKIEFLDHGAVVIAKEIEAKFEPLEKATAYFTLPEGTKVMVVDSSGNWLKVKRSDNKVGWVDRAGISLIYN
ncbi:MAG: tetratricopeptide repeat protein [Candidatus Omnitrophica bacterium]|nr:tetratricopeptide repeat protein [Candidatus Omnitrophota bacterium]